MPPTPAHADYGVGVGLPAARVFAVAAALFGEQYGCLALGANASGLGRAALIAADTDAEDGLVNLVESLSLELQMLTSALGKYHVGLLGPDDLWSAAETVLSSAG